MRVDANRIALRVVESILGAAKPGATTINGTEVTWSASRGPEETWPSMELPNLSGADGPWPRSVGIDCRWDGGHCGLTVRCQPAATPSYRGQVGLLVRLADRPQALIWVTVALAIGDQEDGSNARLRVFMATVKRKSGAEVGLGDRLNAELNNALRSSGLPLVTSSYAELCQFDLPSGAISGGADAAFARLVHLALLKLDFVDRGPHATERGKPLFDLAQFGTGSLGNSHTDDGGEAELEEGGAHALAAETDSLALNQILYGPPGTGKTYALRTSLMPRFTRSIGGQTGLELAATLVDDLTWFEVIALALHGLGQRAKVDALLKHPLLMAKHASQAIPTPLRHMVWGTLGQHAVESSTTVKMKRRVGDLIFDKGQDGTWFLAEPLPETLLETATTLAAPSGARESRDYTFVTFHQAYGYEDFIEGIRPRLQAGDEDETALSYALEDGVFLRAARAALRLTGFAGTLDDFCRLSVEERSSAFVNAPPYAVFIDEINRGNVARILGELITLLEPDKRLGAPNELIVTLPYSRKLFGVPRNLYVIGTMNTADRSVEALDVALRRRFEFTEISPRLDLIDFSVEGDIDVDELLKAINRRLEKLIDRDHCIGHAYLLELKDNPTLDALKRVFRHRIIPLLQEYFFGDWGKIGLVLGGAFVRRRDLGAVELADFDHDDRDLLASRPTWEMVELDKLTNQDFQRIYGHAE
jgi:hypothetical protein